VQFHGHSADDFTADVAPGLPAGAAHELAGAVFDVRLHLIQASDPPDRDRQNKITNALAQVNRPLQPGEQLPAL
jgi:hypothetical protein